MGILAAAAPDLNDGFKALALAAVVSLLATPVAGAIAWRIGAIDTPRERGLHQIPTPRLGGLAILVTVVVGALVFLPLDSETKGILIGATVIALVGAADDILELKADFKLAGQILAAVIPAASGVRVDTMTIPFLGHLTLSEPVSYAFTVVGIVALMNIINFIDGVDGLAAGVCTIAAVTFACIALSLDRTSAGVLAMITAGACIGYLRHGFAPASIFLGDSGSNLLGYLLGTIVVQGALKTNAVIALAFPLVILAVPILDSSFVIAKRIKYGKPIYTADKWHFHHRFANIGFSPRRTALYLYGWTLTLALLALALRFVPYSDDHGHFHLGWSLVLLVFGVGAITASVYLVFVLEILKLKRFRQFQLRRASMAQGEPPPAEAVLDAKLARELETGEFEAVDVAAAQRARDRA
ncbi:MAG: UDP-GlcNAc:undecaprenyl-phosphate/decaprenyl-phosphate GlcNAc-phosphate transferase [Thermoleophilaceae bacterium]|jgi:UDP-GlcNAc:undecaprenyl-phosphate GlcNAc-1-phosphate transferase|nr:UDP-GlcNAc:undecaprenyl-phosphate/decaprenyl-phosphate GlcNAc-phosphate transferase [Thermoleophilaceae bacterium]